MNFKLLDHIKGSAINVCKFLNLNFSEIAVAITPPPLRRKKERNILSN
jgi:hypothetical protein